MTKRTVPVLYALVLCASLGVIPAAASATSDPSPNFTEPATGDGPGATSRGISPYRPDARIKLCGLSTGCTVGPPPPHPWRGNDVYNTTARYQTVKVRLEDGEGVRFWLILENDGVGSDVIHVQGCQGTRKFVVNAVLSGFQKRPTWQAENYTKPFKRGTLEFAFPASKPDKRVKLTVNIVAPTTAEGVTYTCPIMISSEQRPTAKDEVAGRMTTF